MNTELAAPRVVSRKSVTGWAVYDWASSGYTVVILTFVFPVYLTKAVGDDLGGDVPASAWLSWSIVAAGLVIALLAPVSGQFFDAIGRRKFFLALLTALFVGSTAASFLVEDVPSHFWLGLLLLGLGSVFFELAQVPYYAMLRQVSTPATIGRVSGIGFASGYFGGIFLLLIAYVGFVAGDEGASTAGLFGISTANGFNIRLMCVVAAVWIAVFAIPVFLTVPELPRMHADPGADSAGWFGSYRILFRDVRELWAVNRNAVYFLGASALFRDGLNGVFAFGGVLAATVYGLSDGDVILFGVAANVVAGLGALVAGRLDDRLGPRPVIIWSLVTMALVSLGLLFAHGPQLFWVLGLALCLFVGPVQSSSRTFLARLTDPGREGQMFGLYATTGRAISFLSPALFGLFVFVFHADRAGIAGLMIVMLLGLVALLKVAPPRDHLSAAAGSTVP